MGILNHALYACTLDGAGGERRLSGEEPLPTGPEVLWLHLDYADPVSDAWLRGESGLDVVVVEALLAPDPRPRSLVVGDGLLVVLRGVNVNAGADPEDMVSLRMWLEQGRVITLRHRPIAAIQDVAAQLRTGNGPLDTGDVLHEITRRVLDRIGGTVQGIEDAVDALEEQLVTAESRSLRTRLSELRRDSIALRRYLAPQRETIGHLFSERVSWLSEIHRARLREAADRATRYVEALDAARERAAVTSEELSNRLAEQMNHTMYVLSVVAAIFMPLGLLTGLLGINVGGIPGTDSPWAFTLVTLGLLGLGFAQWSWYKRRRIL